MNLDFLAGDSENGWTGNQRDRGSRNSRYLEELSPGDPRRFLSFTITHACSLNRAVLENLFRIADSSLSC
jgi:hypothetical protein